MTSRTALPLLASANLNGVYQDGLLGQLADSSVNDVQQDEGFVRPLSLSLEGVREEFFVPVSL